MTKAQELGITEFPYREYDSNNKLTYWEDSNGLWDKFEYDTNGNKTYHEHTDGFWARTAYNSFGKPSMYYDSNGTWYKSEYDSNGNITYFKNSVHYWSKFECDSNGDIIYNEDSLGHWVITKHDGETLESTHETLYYPEYCKLTYTHWNDDMIIKHENHINWLMLSFLPTLSKNIIEKYSDRLNLNIVKFFNKNLVD